MTSQPPARSELPNTSDPFAAPLNRSTNTSKSPPVLRSAAVIASASSGPEHAAKMTTRSGRRLVLPAPAPSSLAKRDRKVAVSSEWHKIVRSTRFRDLLSLSSSASSPADLARAELKIWNIRHGYAPEMSESKGSLKGLLVDLLESGEYWNQGGEIDQDGNADEPSLVPAQCGGVVSRPYGHNPSDNLGNLKASGHLYNPPHDAATQAAIGRAVAEYEAEHGPHRPSQINESFSIGRTVTSPPPTINCRTVPIAVNRSTDTMSALLDGLVLPQPELETESGSEPGISEGAIILLPPPLRPPPFRTAISRKPHTEKVLIAAAMEKTLPRRSGIGIREGSKGIKPSKRRVRVYSPVTSDLIEDQCSPPKKETFITDAAESGTRSRRRSVIGEPGRTPPAPTHRRTSGRARHSTNFFGNSPTE